MYCTKLINFTEEWLTVLYTFTLYFAICIGNFASINFTIIVNIQSNRINIECEIFDACIKSNRNDKD